MKQTLFEAEAVLSVNTEQLFAGIDQAAKEARSRIERMFGGINVPLGPPGMGTGGGGSAAGGGGRRGGGRSRRGGDGEDPSDQDFFGIEMAMARREKAAGRYQDAMRRIDALLKSQLLSERELIAAATLRDAVERKAFAHRAKMVQLSEEELRKPGPASRINPVQFELAHIRAAKAAGDYAQALQRVKQLLQETNLNPQQRSSAIILQTSIQKAISRAGTRINPFMDEMAATRALKAAGDYQAALQRINQLLQANLTVQQRSQAVQLRSAIEQRIASQARAASQSVHLLAMAQARAAVSAGDLLRAEQILTRELSQLQQGTLAYYRTLTMLQNVQAKIAQGGGLTPHARQVNAAVQNLSFAFQDLITVLSMGGGLSRALAAASNNLAFMAAMMGTLKGAILGLGITAAAVLAPAILKAILGLKDFADSAEMAKRKVEELRDAMREASRRANFGQLLQDFTEGLALPDIEEAIEQRTRERDVQQQMFERGQEELSGIRARLAQDAIDHIDGYLKKVFPEAAQRLTEIFTMFAAGVDETGQKFGVGEMKTAVMRDLYGTPRVHDLAAELAKRYEEAIAEANKPLEEIDRLTEELRALEKIRGDVKTQLESLAERRTPEELRAQIERFGELAPPEVVNRLESLAKALEHLRDPVIDTAEAALNWMDARAAEQEQMERARQDRELRQFFQRTEQAPFGDIFWEQNLEALQRHLPEVQALFNEMFPEAAELAQIRDRFDSFRQLMTFAGIDIPEEEIARAQKLAEADALARLRQPSTIEGVFGPGQFAQQMTSQLLQRQDHQKRLVEWAGKSHGLQEKMEAHLREMKDRLEPPRVFRSGIR